MATSPRFPGSGPRPSFRRILIAAGLAAAVAAPAWAQEDEAVGLEAALQAEWRDNMATIEVAEAKGLITASTGSFATTGVKTEKSVGVPLFGGGGILGPNEYSLQINTNANLTTSACAKQRRLHRLAAVHLCHRLLRKGQGGGVHPVLADQLG